MVRHDDLERHLQLVGDDVEVYLADPRWQPSKFKPDNLVLNSILTITPWHGGKYRFIIGGGEPHFDEEGYKTQELAQRAMFDKLHALDRDS